MLASFSPPRGTLRKARQREPRADEITPAFPLSTREGATVEGGSLAHADEAVAQASAFPGSGTVVDDLKFCLVVLVADRHPGAGGAGVLEGVGKRLLYDPLVGDWRRGK